MIFENQILAGCIPIKNILLNGSMQRNDSEDGGMVYKFHCDESKKGKVCIRAKWPTRPELIPVSVA